MSGKKLVSAVVVALSITLAVPTFAAQPNGTRDRETKESRFTDDRRAGSPIDRVVRVVKRTIRSLDDLLGVPHP
jgi:hypothetical protein